MFRGPETATWTDEEIERVDAVDASDDAGQSAPWTEVKSSVQTLAHAMLRFVM